MMVKRYLLLEAPWIIAGLLLGKAASSYACMVRGCDSIGSELFVLPMIALIGWHVTCAIVDHIEDEDYECEEDEEDE